MTEQVEQEENGRQRVFHSWNINGETVGFFTERGRTRDGEDQPAREFLRRHRELAEAFEGLLKEMGETDDTAAQGD